MGSFFLPPVPPIKNARKISMCVCTHLENERRRGKRGGEREGRGRPRKGREKEVALPTLFKRSDHRSIKHRRSLLTAIVMASSSSSSLAAAMQAFVDEDYASAEEHYSAALAAEKKPGGGDDDAELLAGRAAARLALEDYVGAADDARRAVAASPGLAKAHVRRGYVCVGDERERSEGLEIDEGREEGKREREREREMERERQRKRWRHRHRFDDDEKRTSTSPLPSSFLFFS